MSSLMAPPQSRRPGPQVPERREPSAGDSRSEPADPRWPPLVTMTVLPYVMLWCCVVLTGVIQAGAPGPMYINLGLCAVAAAWMLWMFTLHPAWRERERVMIVFFAGLMLIMFVLAVRASWFGFFTLTGGFFALRLLRWPWRLIGVGLVGVMAGFSQVYGIDKTSAFGLAIFLIVVAVNVARRLRSRLFPAEDGGAS